MRSQTFELRRVRDGWCRQLHCRNHTTRRQREEEEEEEEEEDDDEDESQEDDEEESEEDDPQETPEQRVSAQYRMILERKLHFKSHVMLVIPFSAT